jgi:hypothetical protein
LGDVGLTPALADADLPERCADTLIVHARQSAGGRSPGGYPAWYFVRFSCAERWGSLGRESRSRRGSREREVVSKTSEQLVQRSSSVHLVDYEPTFYIRIVHRPSTSNPGFSTLGPQRSTQRGHLVHARPPLIHTRKRNM